MKSVVIGIGMMVLVSVLAWVVLDTTATTSGEAFVSQNNSVRLD